MESLMASVIFPPIGDAFAGLRHLAPRTFVYKEIN